MGIGENWWKLMEFYRKPVIILGNGQKFMKNLQKLMGINGKSMKININDWKLMEN